MFSKKFLYSIIAATGIIVAGLVLLASNTWNPSWNPFKMSKSGVIEQAIAKLFNYNSFSYQVNVGLMMTSQDASTTTNNVSALLLVDGKFNKSKENSPKTSNDFKLAVSSAGIDFPVVGQIVNVGKNIYLKLDSFPEEPFALLGFDAAQGKWFQLNKETGSRKEEADALIKDLSVALSDKSIFEIKNKTGKEKIGNDTAIHYTVGFSKEGMKQVLPDVLKILAKYASSSISNEQKIAVEQSLINFSDNFEQTWPDSQLSKIIFDVWIDSLWGRLKKVAWQSSIQHPDKPIVLDIKAEVIFADFGKKFSIQAPAETESIDSLVGQIKALGGLSGIGK